MSNCIICGRGSAEATIFNGIYDGKISKVCQYCARDSDIVIVNKPSQEQLNELDKKRSVKEVMHDLTTPKQRTLAKDNIIAHKDLARLRFPVVKQENSDLVSNYDWVLKQARRHMKLSFAQVSEKIGIDRSQIETLESGQITSGFEKVAMALEDFYNVKILLNREQIKLVKTPDERKKREREILNNVEEKMKKHRFLLENRNQNRELGEDAETKHEQIDVNSLIKEKEEQKFKSKNLDEINDELESGRFDFSRKENLDRVTIQDLAELKKLKSDKKSIK